MKDFLDAIIKRPEIFGFNRYCNICGFRFSKFDLFNKIRPREAQCPVCKSLERHRHLYVHLLHIYPFLSGKKVLHFAPESIIKRILCESAAEYYDCDLDPKKATHTVDITNITFENNFFDYIVCIHVLEHIPDDVVAMKELYRVLKPGGIAFLGVPLCKELREDLNITSKEEREKLYGQWDHVRYYSFEVFLK